MCGGITCLRWRSTAATVRFHLLKPNQFDGEASILKAGSREWVDIPFSHTPNIGRGAGVADMAYAIQSGRPHRASGDLAFHVLDIMQALEESAAAGHHIDIASTDRSAAGAAGWLGGWRAGCVSSANPSPNPLPKALERVLNAPSLRIRSMPIPAHT